MKTIKGDLLQLALTGQFDVIIHGCNCFCTMGAGIAKAIRSEFPEAFKADTTTEEGDRKKLGGYSHATVNRGDHTITIINGYSQFNYTGKGVLIDYDAIRTIFSTLKKEYPDKRLAYPKIGAGLAGGDWPTISAIIDQELRGADHTLVIFEPSV